MQFAAAETERVRICLNNVAVDRRVWEGSQARRARQSAGPWLPENCSTELVDAEGEEVSKIPDDVVSDGEGWERRQTYRLAVLAHQLNLGDQRFL